MVVNTYLSIVALKPDHPAALAALAARYEAQGRWTDLIQILTRQADAAADSAQRLALHRRVAALWAEKLGKHQNAVASLEKILETDPSDLETCERLKELYTRSRSWKALLEVYQERVPARPGREAARPPGRDGAAGVGAAQRDARGDPPLEPGAGDLRARPRDAGRPGQPVRARAALAGADRDPRSPAPERRRRSGRRAAAAGTPGDAAVREAGRRTRGRRGVPPHPGAAADPRARRARAARDLRAVGRLQRARGAVRRAGGVRRSVRSADGAGRSHRRHDGAHPHARAGRDPVAGEAESARARAQGLRTDPGDRPAEPQGGDGADPALPDGAEVAASAGDLRGAGRPRARRAGGRSRPVDRRAAAASEGSAADLRAAAGLEVAGLSVVRARLRAGADRPRGDRRPRAAGGRSRRVGRAGDAVRRAARGRGAGWRDRRRAAVAVAPIAARRHGPPVPPAGGAAVRRADPQRVGGTRRRGRGGARADPDPDQVVARPGQAAARARRSHDRRHRAREDAVPHRPVRGGEGRRSRGGGTDPGIDHRDRAGDWRQGDQRAGGPRPDAGARGAAGLGRPGRRAAPRDRQRSARRARRAADAHRADSRDAHQGRERDLRHLPQRRRGESSERRRGRRPRAPADGRPRPRRRDLAPGAAVLRAHRQRRAHGGRARDAAAGDPRSRGAPRAAREAARALRRPAEEQRVGLRDGAEAVRGRSRRSRQPRSADPLRRRDPGHRRPDRADARRRQRRRRSRRCAAICSRRSPSCTSSAWAAPATPRRSTPRSWRSSRCIRARSSR